MPENTGPTLLIGTKESTLKKLSSLGININSGDPDLLIVSNLPDKQNIGIDQARDIKKFLSQKPFAAKVKTVILMEADLLTVEAQNALLKILEEPPEYARLYLLTKTESSLLPTVLSRCIKIACNTVAEGQKPIADIFFKTAGQRLSWAYESSKKDRQEILEELGSYVVNLHENLYKSTTDRERISLNIEKITEVKTDLEETNLNTRLALENLALSLLTLERAKPHSTP